VPVDRAPELEDQPRLADARLADDRHELAAPLRDDVVVRARELLELVGAADQRRFPLSASGSVRAHRGEPVRRHALRLPLQLERLDGLNVDEVAHEPMRELAEEHLACTGGLLEPGGDVDRVAGDEPLPAGRVARDDLARVHARAVDEPDAVAALEVVVQLLERALHARRCADGSERVVLVQLGQPEDRHHRVADELLDRAAVALELGAHGVEVPRHHLAQRLRVERLPEARRAFQVGEDDRDRLPNLLVRHHRRERRPAVPAEPELRRVLLATSRANLHRGSVRRTQAGTVRAARLIPKLQSATWLGRRSGEVEAVVRVVDHDRVVRGAEDRGARLAREARQEAGDPERVRLVELRRRLVEQEDLRTGRERAGKRDSLAFPR
jgi:hypothetical protein